MLKLCMHFETSNIWHKFCIFVTRHFFGCIQLHGTVRNSFIKTLLSDPDLSIRSLPVRLGFLSDNSISRVCFNTLNTQLKKRSTVRAPRSLPHKRCNLPHKRCKYPETAFQGHCFTSTSRNTFSLRALMNLVEQHTAPSWRQHVLTWYACKSC